MVHALVLLRVLVRIVKSKRHDNSVKLAQHIVATCLAPEVVRLRASEERHDKPYHVQPCHVILGVLFSPRRAFAACECARPKGAASSQSTDLRVEKARA